MTHIPERSNGRAIVRPNVATLRRRYVATGLFIGVLMCLYSLIEQTRQPPFSREGLLNNNGLAYP